MVVVANKRIKALACGSLGRLTAARRAAPYAWCYIHQKRKIMKYLTFVLFLVASNVYAGTGLGKVHIEHVGDWNNKPMLFFYVSGNSNKPPCNTTNNRWVIDLSSDLGKMQYSFILAAQASDKEIRVGGKGSCNIFSGSEDVHWVGSP